MGRRHDGLQSTSLFAHHYQTLGEALSPNFNFYTFYIWYFNIFYLLTPFYTAFPLESQTCTESKAIYQHMTATKSLKLWHKVVFLIYRTIQRWIYLTMSMWLYSQSVLEIQNQLSSEKMLMLFEANLCFWEKGLTWWMSPVLISWRDS